MSNPIAGTIEAMAEQLAQYLLSNNESPKINCSALELASIYIEEGNTEGLRGDVAFCQAIKETGFFMYGNQVKWTQNNYCGLGATNPAGSVIPEGATFKDPREGVRAHIQHLKAYASKTPPVNPIVDPRYETVGKVHGFGCATNWEDLNGRWAVPGVGYGQEILSIYESAKKIKIQPSVVDPEKEETENSDIKQVIKRLFEFILSLFKRRQ